MSDTDDRYAINRDSASLFLQIVHILRKRILSGEFGPGEYLPSERELASEMEVSRVPVREALKALEFLGVLKQVRGRGLFVQKINLAETLKMVAPFSQEPSVVDLFDLFEYRLLIEPYVAGRAAERASAEQIKILRDLVDNLQKAKSNKTIESTANKFHLQLMVIAGNDLITSIGFSLTELLRFSRHKTLWNNERRCVAVDFHKKILSAIESGDRALATKLMYEHILDAKSNLNHL